MALIFLVIPIAMLLLLDGSAAMWWTRRQALLRDGTVAAGEILRINVSVTHHADPNGGSSLSTTMRPVVRFTTGSGEVITTSPMRSGVDKFLIPGEPAKIRYNPAQPMRCVIDQPRGANQGVASGLVGLAVMNVFLIGFTIFAQHIAGGIS